MWVRTPHYSDMERRCELGEETDAKLLDLTTQLLETKRNKKEAMKAYNDQIKRLEAEIEEIVEGK